MGYLKRLDNAFLCAPTLTLTPQSKFVIMSDSHRGIGNTNDIFLKNEVIFLSALQFYYDNDYSYIELGDGDELWKNRSLKAIQEAYEDIFQLIDKFYRSNRLYLLFGNHDIEKCKKDCKDGYTYKEGFILKDSLTGQHIHLTHGHQADILNSTLWKLSRFLVRYVWKPLEMYGISNPISAANNYEVKEKTEKRLNQWAIKRDTLLVCGHTHRAVIGSKLSPYFNSGCCIYPGCITALEIINRQISLVKWKYATDKNHYVYIKKEIIDQPVNLSDIFHMK